MMRFVTFVLWALALSVHADTMDHYMNISNQIPQMLMKADQQSQVWARSARSVLEVTHETIAETLIQANELAKTQGKELFCLPQGVHLNAEALNEIIQKTYKDLSSQQSDKDKMTVSQVAFLGVTKAYPCNGQAQNLRHQEAANQASTPKVQAMQHVSAALGKSF